MRGSLRALVYAWMFGLGALAGCFREDFLLGAGCARDSDCGDDQCCSGGRCRLAPCDRGESEDTSDDQAYSACTDDDECQARGLPHCVRLEGASRGFCADLCQGIPANCETHPDSSSLACVELSGQRLCALRCCSSAACESDTDPDPCPDHMVCLDDVCVPEASP